MEVSSRVDQIGGQREEKGYAAALEHLMSERQKVLDYVKGLRELRTQLEAAGACFHRYRENNVSSNTCAAGDATQNTDVPALVMRFSVQLPLKRGATTPPSL